MLRYASRQAFSADASASGWLVFISLRFQRDSFFADATLPLMPLTLRFIDYAPILLIFQPIIFSRFSLSFCRFHARMPTDAAIYYFTPPIAAIDARHCLFHADIFRRFSATLTRRATHLYARGWPDAAAISYAIDRRIRHYAILAIASRFSLLKYIYRGQRLITELPPRRRIDEFHATIATLSRHIVYAISFDEFSRD
jgi:hypothetical protein